MIWISQETRSWLEAAWTKALSAVVTNFKRDQMRNDMTLNIDFLTILSLPHSISVIRDYIKKRIREMYRDFIAFNANHFTQSLSFSLINLPHKSMSEKLSDWVKWLALNYTLY